IRQDGSRMTLELCPAFPQPGGNGLSWQIVVAMGVTFPNEGPEYRLFRLQGDLGSTTTPDELKDRTQLEGPCRPRSQKCHRSLRSSVSPKTKFWSEKMAKHDHHEKAAHHHEQAAKHHREAAKHHQAGNHEKAAHHSKIAHGHHLHAVEHHDHA